jgi:hypothetical protein
VWMGTGRSEFMTVQVDQCPFTCCELMYQEYSTMLTESSLHLYFHWALSPIAMSTDMSQVVVTIFPYF